jgi:hypothetical protein
MSETPELEVKDPTAPSQDNSEAVVQSARIMFTTLNAVYTLHNPAEVRVNGIDGEKCVHCSIIAGRVVEYPCPTVNLLLRDMVTEDEETPAA